MTNINTEEWVTLKQAVEITGQNTRFIQRKYAEHKINGLDCWGLNHRVYERRQVEKFIKEKDE